MKQRLAKMEKIKLYCNNKLRDYKKLCEKREKKKCVKEMCPFICIKRCFQNWNGVCFWYSNVAWYHCLNCFRQNKLPTSATHNKDDFFLNISKTEKKIIRKSPFYKNIRSLCKIANHQFSFSFYLEIKK